MSAVNDPILLSHQNMETIGFSMFHYPGEEQLINNTWHRDVGPFSYPGITYPVDHIAIPGSFLMQLSTDKGKRLIDLPGFSNRMNGGDINPMKLLCERAGWNQTTEDLLNYLELAGDANFLATIDVDGALVPLGCGAVYLLGKEICWISMILVHPEVRRQGIARSIMEYCIQHIHSKAEIPIIGLDASEMGLGLYESMGFKESSRIWRCKISASEEIEVHTSVSIRQVANILECLPYLKMRLADHKIDLVKLLTDKYKGFNYAAISGDKVVGLMMSRPGRRLPFIGPLIADNDEIAANLVNHSLRTWKLSGATEVFMDIPDNHFSIPGEIISGNPGTVSFPENHSFIKTATPVRGFVRMYYEKSERTRNYMKKENDKIIPFLYGTAGPELS